MFYIWVDSINSRDQNINFDSSYIHILSENICLLISSVTYVWLLCRWHGKNVLPITDNQYIIWMSSFTYNTVKLDTRKKSTYFEAISFLLHPPRLKRSIKRCIAICATTECYQSETNRRITPYLKNQFVSFLTKYSVEMLFVTYLNC